MKMSNKQQYNNIRWIIQNNLLHENDLKQLQDTCKELNIDFEDVQVIPFSTDIPEFTIDNKINIYYGSTTLMYNIYNKLNKPTGLFFDDVNFSMKNYINIWGKHMLNSDAQLTTFKEFSNQKYDDNSLWFVRPDADDKSFNGDVKTFKEIVDWSKTFTLYDNVILTEDTKIVICEPYNIQKEWRTYIVNGKVISASLYRKDFRLHKSNLDIPEDMIKFVEDRCKEYMPHKIFAMDIALVNDDVLGNNYYIIECGCMNSVGFYAADISKIVYEISKFINNV